MKKYSYICFSTKDGKFREVSLLVVLGNGVYGKSLQEIKDAAVRIAAEKMEIDPSTIVVLHHTFIGDALILD